MRWRETLIGLAVAGGLGLAGCGSAAQHTHPDGGTTSAGSSTLPKAHPQVINPTAGDVGRPATTSDPVGDPNAHAPSLTEVKHEIKEFNVCGGTTNRADAAPIASSSGPGFVADPGTQQTEGELPVITARLNQLAHDLGVTIYGISGYRSPAHSVAVGGFADDPHTRGLAEDIGVNSLLRSSAAQITEAQLATVGLYRPFDPSDDPNNTEVNHVQLIPSGGALSVSQAESQFSEDPLC